MNIPFSIILYASKDSSFKKKNTLMGSLDVMGQRGLKLKTQTKKTVILSFGSNHCKTTVSAKVPPRLLTESGHYCCLLRK